MKKVFSAQSSFLGLTRSLLLTKSPLKLIDFYQKTVGLIFSKLSIGKHELYHSRTSSLCIVSHTSEPKKSIGGILTFQVKKTDGPNYTMTVDPSEKFAWMKIFLSPNQLQKIPVFKADDCITVLRHTPIEETVKFFKYLGEWKHEKHGAGPWHFSCVQDKHVIEIYPPRKSASHTLMELMIPPSCLLKKVENFPPFLTIVDPDGRQIRIVENAFIDGNL